MTSKEIGLFYNGSGWGTFIRNSERKGKEIRGSPPKEWYRIYDVDESTSLETMRLLRTRAVHLEDQNIVPSERNYEKVFPDLSELTTNP